MKLQREEPNMNWQLRPRKAAMKRIKEKFPEMITVVGGLMYTAIPKEIVQENPR